MNVIQRTMKSITRNLTKYILLSLVVIFMGILISSSLAILQSSDYLSKSIENKLGSMINISLNEDGMSLLSDYLFNDQGAQRIKDENKIQRIFNETVDKNTDKIAFAECVKHIAFQQSHLVFDRVKTYSTLEEVEIANQISTSMLGVTNSSFTDIQLANIVIVEGRTFTDAELKNGDNVIIIDRDYYWTESNCPIMNEKTDFLGNQYYECRREIQELQLGDTLTFTSYIENNDTKQVIESEYTIIGFYSKINKSSTTNLEKATDDLIGNIYAPQKALDKEFEKRVNIGVSHDRTEGMYSIHSLVMITTTTDVNKSLSETLSYNFKSEGVRVLDVSSSTDIYEAIAGPLESLRSASIIFLIISIVITILVVSIVINMMLKDRKREMGIYLSLGDRKRNIAAQIMLEIFVIGIVAITVSVFAGNYCGDAIANKLLSTQYEKQQEIIEMKLEELHGVDTEIVNTTIVLDEFEVKFSLEYFVMFYMVGSLVLVVSSYIPIRNTLKVKPKEILM